MTNTKMTNSEALKVDSMLRKIARKKFHQFETLSSRVDYEDVVQELWLKALDIFSRYPEMSFEDKRKMIAKASFDKIVDIVRYEARRPSISIDPSRFDREDERDSGESKSENNSKRYIDLDTRSRIDSQLDVVEVKEILDLFEEGSKQRRYIELMISYFCDLDSEFFNSNEDYSSMEGGQSNNWNSWVARQLGFGGASSSGYQRIRYSVRAKLAQSGYAQKYPEALARFGAQN